MEEAESEFFPIELEYKTKIDGKEYGLRFENSSQYFDAIFNNIKRAHRRLLKRLGKTTK